MIQNAAFGFQKVTRAQVKASIFIEGLSGKGKSGLALLIGYYLANKQWDKVAVSDTENRSIALFSDMMSSAGVPFKDFLHGDFAPELGYKPSHYQQFIENAINAGCEAHIADSLSHAWTYQGGILDMVTEINNSSSFRKGASAWGDDKVIAEKQRLYQLVRNNKIHMISTIRVKEKIAFDEENGKTKITSLGEQQIMQADMKYEFDLGLRMISPGNVKENGLVTHPVAECIKSRYAIFEEGVTYEFTPELLESLKNYLLEGTSPEELLEKQRQEYIKAVKEFLDSASETKRNYWQTIKATEGVKDTKLEDLTIDVLRKSFSLLTED